MEQTTQIFSEGQGPTLNHMMQVFFTFLIQNVLSLFKVLCYVQFLKRTKYVRIVINSF